MAISTQIQNLNLIPGKSVPVVVHLSQGNVGNTVQFYLYDGDRPYYPTNVSIAVHGVRADNTVFGPYAVSVTSGSNLVSFDIVTAMTSVAGAAIGELVISDSGQNQIGSANFGMLVETTPYSTSVTYEDDLSIYQRILAYVQSIPGNISGQIATEASERQSAIEAERTARTTAMETEATTRANAVSTLESRIAAEETARASGDSNLQTQINQIVAPSGSAPSAAEVQNARIGQDGLTYATLGDAIRRNDERNYNAAYLYHENIAANTYTEKDYVIDKRLMYELGVAVVLTNLSASQGYFTIRLLDKDNEIISASTAQLLSTGQQFNWVYNAKDSATFGKGYDYYLEPLKFRILTPNKSAYHISIAYNRSDYINSLIKELPEIKQRVLGDDGSTVQRGYITQNGLVSRASSADNLIYTFRNVKRGDQFVYTGGYGWGVVWGYYADGTAVNLIPGSKRCVNYVITITDENIKTVRGWGTANGSSNFPDVSFKRRTSEPIEYTVDLYGRGDFSDIQSAIDYAKDQCEQAAITTPVTIHIKNGIYQLTPRSDRAYVIDKGANMISLIGESRDQTIITLTNTPAVNNKILEVGGHCTIANLTLKNLWNDDGSTYSGSHNAYCLHNDISAGYETPYVTTVENCYLYSEAFCPVGAGLQSHQTQVYKDCVFEYNCLEATHDYAQHGALYVHSPSSSTAGDCAVVIDNCTCISKCGTKALELPNVSGSLSYVDIPVTIRRSIGVTNGSVISNVTASTHKLTSDCKLNSVSDWNV